MLTTEQPMALADVMTMLLFSVIWNAFKGFRGVGLFSTRISMVSGTESLISLHMIRPSRASSKSCIVSVGIGMREPTSGSPSRIYKKSRPSSVPGVVSETSYTHSIDVICKLPPLVFIDGVADVRVGALYCDLSGLGGDGRSLRAELDVELSDEDRVKRCG